MKKFVFCVLTSCAALAALAAVDDVLLMFSTKGPDKYSNGDDVLAGECYALCYVTDAATFAIKSDGTADAGGEVLVTAPMAAPMKDGSGMHCPSLVYAIPAAKVASLTNGSYAVYLLDTRVPDASNPGVYRVAGLSGGKAAVVNGAGQVASGGTVGAGTSGIATYNGTVVAGGSVSDVSVVDQPNITAIDIVGAEVVLTVSSLSPAVDYMVLTGSGPSDFYKEVEATRSGNTLSVNKDDVGQFFKVKGYRVVEQ